MTPLQQTIVQAAKANPSLTYEALADLVGCSCNYASKTLREQRSHGGGSRGDWLSRQSDEKTDRVLTAMREAQRRGVFLTRYDVEQRFGWKVGATEYRLRRMQKDGLIEPAGRILQMRASRRHYWSEAYRLTPDGMRRARAISPSAAPAKTH